MIEIFKPGINIPWIPNRRVFYAISATLITASLITIGIKGFNYGIDFAGGSEMQVKFPAAADEAPIKEALMGLDLGEPVVQRFGPAENNEYLIRIRKVQAVSEAALLKVKAALAELAGKDNLVSFAYSSESGERIAIELKTPLEAARIQALFTSQRLDVRDVVPGAREDKPTYTVTLASIADRVEQALRTKFAIDPTYQLVSRVEFVGPQVGKQLRNQGVMALLYSLVFMFIYIAIRFDLFFGPGAIVALFHDSIIVLGVFSLFGIEFNLPFIAALLTIVGYSINDTIVVFDRIRETIHKYKGMDQYELCNKAINETLSRTVLTSGVTSLVVVALLIFGGGVIFDFSLALLIGIAIGTYSSIAIATPVYLILWDKFANKKPVAA